LEEWIIYKRLEAEDERQAYEDAASPEPSEPIEEDD